MGRIGFIGLGVMGQSMARNLLRADCELVVHNRTAAKAQPLVDKGARLADSPGDVASRCNVIITMLGYPSDVEQVYLGEGGIAERALPKSLWIDMTTSSPALARKIAEAAAAKQCAALDAPVSGGDVGAREARLSIMVGGEPEAFDQARPLFEMMGQNIVRQGAAGSGQLTKMANQIAVAAATLGTAEALAFAKRAGLDPSSVLQSIESGAAGSWSLSHLGPRMLAGNFDPGFYVKHIVKDLGIAVESARALGLNLPGLELARRLYRQLEEDGGANLGTQAIYRLYCGLAPADQPAPARGFGGVLSTGGLARLCHQSSAARPDAGTGADLACSSTLRGDNPASPAKPRQARPSTQPPASRDEFCERSGL